MTHTCARLTNIVSAVANVGRYLVHALAIKSSHLLSKRTGQFFINGSVDTQTHTQSGFGSWTLDFAHVMHFVNLIHLVHAQWAFDLNYARSTFRLHSERFANIVVFSVFGPLEDKLLLCTPEN